GQLLVPEPQLAPVGPVQAPQEVQEGRLAGAGAADGGDVLAGDEAQVDTAQHLDRPTLGPPKALAEPDRADQVSARGALRRPSAPSPAARVLSRQLADRRPGHEAGPAPIVV